MPLFFVGIVFSCFLVYFSVYRLLIFLRLFMKQSFLCLLIIPQKHNGKKSFFGMSKRNKNYKPTRVGTEKKKCLKKKKTNNLSNFFISSCIFLFLVAYIQPTTTTRKKWENLFFISFYTL